MASFGWEGSANSLDGARWVHGSQLGRRLHESGWFSEMLRREMNMPLSVSFRNRREFSTGNG